MGAASSAPRLDSNGVLVSQSRIRDAEWIRLANSDDVLSFDAQPPEYNENKDKTKTETEENGGNEYEDDCYCNFCNQYGHRDSACPLLTVITDSKEKKTEHILTSDEASLMEGLIDDEVVRKSFMISLSNDLVKHSNEKSGFSTALLDRVQTLAIVHQALVRAREHFRTNNLASLEELSKYSATVQKSNNKSAASLAAQQNMLLRMNVELLKASTGVTPDSPICSYILNTLTEVLTQNSPGPLTMGNSDETLEFAESVANWLVSLVVNQNKTSATVADVKRRAVLLLLHLVLQRGSLLTALQLIKMLGLSGDNNLTIKEYEELLAQFQTLKPSVRLTACLADTRPQYLGNWLFKYPNHIDSEMQEESEKKSSKRGAVRGRRGRRHPRFRARGGKFISDDEDGDEEGKANLSAGVDLTNDGSYLYVITSENGLARVGTGYNNTLRGHVYALKTDAPLKSEDHGRIAYVNNRLYYRSNNSKNNIHVLDPVTLNELSVIVLPKTIVLDDYAPLTACHRYLYIIANSQEEDKKEEKDEKKLAKKSKKEQKFEVITLDPQNNLAIVKRTLLHSMLDETPSQPASLPGSRPIEACESCRKFHYSGPSYTGATNSYGRWCEECQKRGYRMNEKTILAPIQTNATTEFPCWYTPQPKGVGPSARFGHKACLLKGKLLAEDLKSKAQNAQENETKEKIEADAKETESKEADPLTTEEQNLVWIFGGASGRAHQYTGAPTTIDLQFNDMYIFNADNNTWYTPSNIQGEAPSARLGHSMTLVDGNKLYVFGGGKEDSGDDAFSDLFVFDIVNREWSKPLCTGSTPEGRLWHGTCLYGDEMFVHGGKGANSKVLTDLFSLNVRTFKWTSYKTAGLPSPQRYGHILIPHQGDILVLGGVAHESMSATSLPQYKIEVPKKSANNPVSDESTKDITKLTLKWSLLGKCQYYHILCGAAWGIYQNKILFAGGGFQSSFCEQTSIFDLDTLTWSQPTITGKTVTPFGFCASAMVDSKLYIFGGCEQNHSLDKVVTIELAADPNVALTSECLKEGCFFTNGKQISMMLPPLLAPNVVLLNNYMSRVFSLNDGSLLYDVDCETAQPGHACSYDPRNNVIWSYDRAKHLIRRFANTDPAPTQIEAKTVDYELKQDQLVSNLSLRLLNDIDQFASFVMPVGSTYDPREFDETKTRSEFNFEPFSVEVSPDTFAVLYDLLLQAKDAWNKDLKNIVYLRSIDILLRLLGLNIHRLQESQEFSFLDIIHKSTNKPLSDQFYQLLRDLINQANDAGDIGNKIRIAAYEVLAIGINLLLPNQAQRINWLTEFLKNELNESSSANNKAVNAALIKVIDRICLNRQASLHFLTPSHHLEGPLPLKIYSVDEIPLENNQSKSKSLIKNNAAAKDLYGPEAMLEEGEVNFCSRGSKNVNVVFQHANTGQLIQPTSFKIDISIKASNVSNTEAMGQRKGRAVHSGLLFVLESASEAIIAKTKQFDNFTKSDYETWLQKKTAKNEVFQEYEPIGWFNFESDAEKKQAAELKKIQEKENKNKYNEFEDETSESSNSDSTTADSFKTVSISPVLIDSSKRARRVGQYFMVKLLRPQDEILKAAGAKDTKKNKNVPQAPLILVGSAASANIAATQNLSITAAASTEEVCILVKSVTLYGLEGDQSLKQAILQSDEKLVQKLSMEPGLNVLKLLLDKSASYTVAALEADPANQASSQFVEALRAKSSTCLRLLQTFQADLISRAAQICTKKKSQTKSEHQSAVLAAPVQLLFEYSHQLLEHAMLLLKKFQGLQTQIEGKYNNNPAEANKIMQQKLEELSHSFLKALVPPLLTSLFFFTQSVTFILRILPVATQLLQSLDTLSQSSSTPSQLSYVGRILSEFECSYLGDANYRLQQYVKNNLQLSDGTFECKNCNSEDDNEEKGKTYTSVQAMATHLEENHIDVVRTASIVRSHWLIDLERTLSSLSGRAAASLVKGNPANYAELDHAKWLESPLFAGGLELTEILAYRKRKLAATQSNAMNQLDTDDVFESIADLEANVVANKQAKIEAEFLSIFVGEISSGKTEFFTEKQVKAIRLLSAVNLKLTNIVGFQYGSYNQANKLSATTFHPAITRALAYARAAIIKQLGTIKEVMQFAEVFAEHHKESEIHPEKGLELNANDLPLNLRIVWNLSEQLKQHMITERQASVQGQGISAVNTSERMVDPDAKSDEYEAEKAQLEQQIREEEEEKKKTPEQRAKEAEEKKKIEEEAKAAALKAEQEQKERELKEASKDGDIYEKLAKGIIDRAKLLLKVQSAIPSPPASVTNTPSAPSEPSARPGLLRSLSDMSNTQHMANATPAESSVQPSTESKTDWLSLQATVLNRSPSTEGAEIAPAGLKRQLSTGPQGNHKTKSKTKGNTSTISAHLLQYFKSATEADPAVAAAAELAKQKNKSKKGPAAVAAENETEEDKVHINTLAMEGFLVKRRYRASSRVIGLSYFQSLCTCSSYLSVLYELLRHLAPALRNEKDNDKSFELTPAEEKKSTSSIYGDGYDQFGNQVFNVIDKKAKKDEADLKKSVFHYSDYILGSGEKLMAKLKTQFENLYVKLGATLETQVKVIEQQQAAASSAVSPHSVTSPASALSQSAVITPSSPVSVKEISPASAYDPLCLAILACFGMNFSVSDHRFLQESNVIHTLRRLMEMEVVQAPTAQHGRQAPNKAQSQANNGVSAAVQASRTKLKASAWGCFRILALSSFINNDANKSATASVIADLESLPPTPAPLSAQVSSSSGPQLSKFQVALVELTFNIIKSTANVFTDVKLLEELRQKASKEATQLKRAVSNPNADFDNYGGDQEPRLDDPEMDLQFASPTEDEEEEFRAAAGDAEDEQEDDIKDEFGASGDIPEEENPAAADPDSANQDSSATASTNTSADTCFQMIRLMLSIVGPATGNSAGKVFQDKKLGDEEKKAEELAQEEASRAIVEYLSTPRFISLFFSLLAKGPPRVQRLVTRLLRRLLPLQSPADLQVSPEDLGDSKDVIDYLLTSIGKLLCIECGQEKSDALSIDIYRNAQVSFALASELIALVRILFASNNWFEHLRSAILSALAPIATLIDDDSLTSENRSLQVAMAAISVIGGFREAIRVGGKVQIYSAKNRKKRKLATVLAYDPVASTAKVVYDAVTAKKVESVVRGSNMVAVEEIPFDPQLLPLTDKQTTQLLQGFLAVLKQTIQTSAKPTSAVEAAPPTSQAAQEEKMKIADEKTDDEDEKEEKKEENDDEKSEPISTPAVVQAESVPAIPPKQLIVVQLRSRVSRALWTLLHHRPSVNAIIKAGFGPELSKAVTCQSSIVIADPTTGLLEDTERKADRLNELCHETKLIYQAPTSVGNAASMLSEQAEMIPFNPYRNIATCPTKMTFEDPLMVAEDDNKWTLVTTGRVVAWDDEISSWSNVPISNDLPSFYFEATILNRGADGQMSIGIYSATRPKKYIPGNESGSIGLSDNGYIKQDRRQLPVEWPKTCSSSVNYWAEGDVVGVLLNRLTGQISFTHNGVIKEDAVRFSAHRSYVVGVGLGAPGARVYVNLGQKPFRYDFAGSKFVPKQMRTGTLQDVEEEVQDSDDDWDNIDSATDGKPDLSITGSSRKSVPATRGGKADPRRHADFGLAAQRKADEELMMKKKLAAAGGDKPKEDEKSEKKDEKKSEQQEEKKPAVAQQTNKAEVSDEKEDKDQKSEEKKDDAKEEKTDADKEQKDNLGGPDADGDELINDVDAALAAELDDPATAAGFDDWKSDSEFSDGEGGSDEDQPSSDDEDQKIDDNQDDYYNNYDRYGNKKKKKVKVPPLTIDQCQVGMTLAIKPAPAEKDPAVQTKKKRNNNSKDKDTKSKPDRKAGHVLEVDHDNRTVLLSVYDPESASSKKQWYSISNLARLRPRVNADIHAETGNAPELMLLRSFEHESCLGLVYTRNALLTAMQHALFSAEKKQEQQQQQVTYDSADVTLTIIDLGGAESVLAALKRAALDEFSNPASRVSATAVDLDNDSNTTEMSFNPVEVYRKFLLHVLRPNKKEKISALEQSERERLAVLMKEEAITQLTLGSGGKKSTWVDRIRSKEHVALGCFLVDLLLTADQSNSYIPVSASAKFLKQSSVQKQTAAADQLSSSHSPIFHVSVYNALIQIVRHGKKLKKFKPSKNDTQVYPLLSRLISQLTQFPANELPELRRLEWLSDKMKARYAEEIKYHGQSSAVSKSLQSIINLILVLKEQQKQQQEAEAKKAADEKKAAEDEQNDPTYTGPDFDKLDWFGTTMLVSDLMKAVEAGKGFPAWFIRRAWLEMQVQSKAIVQESAHPYISDLPWQELTIPNAQSMTIHLEAKSSTDSSDKLRFAVKKCDLDPTSTSEELTEIACFSGPNMNKSGVGTHLMKTGSGAELKGNKVYVSFEQSSSPTHPNVFCKHCDFPVKGNRFVCSHCDGKTDPNAYYRRRNDRDESYNLCAACEKANQDSGLHDRTHVFVAIKRPLPQSCSVPRIAPAVHHLYSSEDIRLIKAGNKTEVSKHNIKCDGCNSTSITGVRFKCSICPEYNLCGACEAADTHKHDRTHPLLKFWYPMKSTTGFNGLYKQFIESVLDNDSSWGYKFTVKPVFPPAYLKELLKQNVDRLNSSTKQLSNPSNDASVEINMYQQCVEMINRSVEKLMSASKESKKAQQARRNRRLQGYNDPSPADASVSAEELAVMLDPKQIVKGAKDLVVYQHLQNSGLEEVHMRMSVLRLLNQRLLSVLPLVDFSLCNQKWSLSHVFGRLRGLVFSQMKMSIWRAALAKSQARAQARQTTIEIDNHLASRARDMAEESDPMDVCEATIFGQMFSQLRKIASTSLRMSYQPWQIRYKSESGYDAGGLFRDSLSRVCLELQADYVPLFIPCPNARHGVGITLDKFIPNRKCNTEMYLAMYEFVGKLMGVAIRTSNTLELDLPSLIWKPLVGMELEIGDLTAIDQICVNAMNAILDNKGLLEKGVTEENFEDIYTFDFTYSASDGSIIELKENGSDYPVTWANRAEYAKLVLEYRLHEFSNQVAAIRRGLTSVIPARFLSLLTWKELELEVCGSPEIDIELLKANTTYQGCSVHDQHIKFFWAVLEKFTQLERAQFLRFAWGRSRLPPPAKFTEKMRIDAAHFGITHLPHAHTCFFSIELPRYTSEDMMRDKLIKAVTFCTSMELA